MQPFLHALAIGFFLLSTAGCGEETSPGADAETHVRPVRYTILKAESQDLSRTFSGTAEADKESILSFKVPGTIQSIPVDVGDRVRADTLLAELDKTDLTVELESARAGLKGSQADAKSAQTSVYTTRSNYTRVQNLYENDNVSLSEFEQARGDYETALAQLQAAESRIRTETAKLQAARNQLQYTRLTAPFEGIINRIAVEENEEVASGAAIMTLSGLGNLKVKVSVSDLYITRISKGVACRITFPALPDAEFTGTVTEVPYAASEAPTYPVSIDIRDRDDRLRPGMAARVVFLLGEAVEESGLHVPADGVGEERGENFVYVVEPGEDGSGTVRKRGVSLGELTEEGFAVKKGLSAGEIVATSGLHLLMDGMAVKLLEDPVREW
jgi:membrane fusion protein, multidrug efflux system